MPVARQRASPPFASRDFNGEGLLDELAEMRRAQVSQKQLDEAARALKELAGCRAPEAFEKIRQLAHLRFAGTPAVAGLMKRWAAKFKSEVDVAAFVDHFERLAIVSAAVVAFRRGAERLPKGGRI